MLEFIENTKSKNLKKRIAVIDIGSNAVRLYWADSSSPGHYEIVQKVRVPLRLGRSVFKNGDIDSNQEKELITTLNEFKKIIHQSSVSKFVCVATSAMRDAKNSKEICQKVFSKTGLNIKIISGQEEALLIQQAVRQAMPNLSAPCLFLDIGGGSTEIGYQDKSSILKLESFQVGTVRILENLTNETEKFQTYLKELLQKKAGSITVVGTGGNLRRLSKLKKKILDKSDSKFLKISEFNQIYKEIITMSPIKLMKKYDLKHDRAEVIGPALSILKMILDLVPSDGIHLPQIGLANALLHELSLNEELNVLH
jgi:exopolyphosphatase/guanosine-5'-triphosphate,3'-diphosphate pyrophosphatase